jgi:hypothetical protein
VRQDRPTADYSWPSSGHWTEWLAVSPNSTIDLDSDFPWVSYITYKDLASHVLSLKALGEPVL